MAVKAVFYISIIALIQTSSCLTDPMLSKIFIRFHFNLIMYFVFIHV
jgi:hypothetical protein